MVRVGGSGEPLCDDLAMTDDARKHSRRLPRKRARALALAGLLATATIACDGSLGSTQNEPDPNVRGTFSGYFVWAKADPAVAIPPLEPAVADEAVRRAADSIAPARDPRFGISIVATYENGEAAAEQAVAVRKILADSAAWYADRANDSALAQLEDDERPAPITPPEIAALRERLLAPGERGVGWGGAADWADDAVYTVGPVLIVTGLKSETPADSEAGTNLPIHPLAHLLAAAGGDVLLEGDRYGEGSIVADVSCRPAGAASGLALLDELGDAILTAGQFSTRPPWIGPAPTAREALARATMRRYQQGAAAALGDRRLQELARRLAGATQEEYATALQEFNAYLRERGLELINGEVDPEVLARLLDTNALSDPAVRQAWARDLGERMGRLPVEASSYGEQPLPDDYARLATSGTVRLQDGRLEMGWLSFGRLAAGLPSLAGYLTARGCGDIRIGLVDFDQVRKD
jgi:hypothetical protein